MYYQIRIIAHIAILALRAAGLQLVQSTRILALVISLKPDPTSRYLGSGSIQYQYKTMAELDHFKYNNHDYVQARNNYNERNWSVSTLTSLDTLLLQQVSAHKFDGHGPEGSNSQLSDRHKRSQRPRC